MQSEPREHEGMPWKTDRPEHGALEPRPVLDHRAYHPQIGVAIRPQRRGGSVERSFHENGAGIVERTADHDGRHDPFQPVRRERKAPPERRRNREQMNGRADVVNKAGEGELGRPYSAADGLFRLEHHDLASGSGKDDGRAQTVRPRTDDNRIRHSYD
jgi:hypothetical protein